MNIPMLKATDIECRVQQVRKTYNGAVEAVLLLYKNARCDMKYLDMLYGVTGWKRSHRLISDRLYCTVEIWDDVKCQWIGKEDVGTESNTEKEKGQASDSFKRACFNIGIGRELYTAPNIKIELNDKEYSAEGGKYRTYATFTVKEIEYNDEREISKLVIVDRFGRERYTYSQGVQQPKTDIAPEKTDIAPEKSPRELLILKLHEKSIDVNEFAKQHNLSNKTTADEFKRLLGELEG